jgi:hypothetical protein
MIEYFNTLREVIDLAEKNGFKPICAIVESEKPSKLPDLALPIGSFDLTKLERFIGLDVNPTRLKPPPETTVWLEDFCGHRACATIERENPHRNPLLDKYRWALTTIPTIPQILRSVEERFRALVENYIKNEAAYSALGLPLLDVDMTTEPHAGLASKMLDLEAKLRAAKDAIAHDSLCVEKMNW